MRWQYNSDRYNCTWCACRRFRSMAALDAHTQEHKEADRRTRENGVAPKDSRAMAERLAATVEIEATRERGERLVRVLP